MSLFPSRRKKEEKEPAPARIAPLGSHGYLSMQASMMPGVTRGETLTVNGTTYQVDKVTHQPDGTVYVELKSPVQEPLPQQGFHPGGFVSGGYVAVAPQGAAPTAYWPVSTWTSTLNVTSTPVSTGGGGGITPPCQCRACGKYLLAGQSASMLCRQCATREAEKLPLSTELQVVQQDDLIQATKYARLSLDKDGKPCFRGTGYGGNPYYTESEAVCGQYKTHPVPDVGCQCGFWVGTRDGSRLAKWDPKQVALEVELGGTVLECAREGTKPDEPPWGYRAQWQRVLSVALSVECGMAARAAGKYYASGWSCDGPPLYLCAVRSSDMTAGTDLLTSCRSHVDAGSAIKKPVSFLRTFLQTEIRPGTVTDDTEPPPQPATLNVMELQREWEAAVRRIAAKLVPTSSLGLDQLSPGKPGAVREISVAGGVTYTVKYVAGRWGVDHVDCPELDALRKKSAEIQDLHARGRLSSSQMMSLSTYINLPMDRL